MKSEKGITLMSLIFYVIAVTIIVGIIALMTSFFYTNTETMNESSAAIGEFDILNLEIVKEVKKEGNKIVSISQNENKVTFSSGTVFTFQDNGIYNDKTKICTGVEECSFRKVMQEEKEILRVFFKMGDFAKTMEYVVGGVDGSNNTNAANEENYTTTSELDYIQNGLVARYSADNNTGSGHSSTTNTWRDLSSNHNDAIVNNVTWEENYVELNGTTSWINCGKQDLNTQTLVVVCMLNNKHLNAQRLIGNWENGGAGIYISDLTKMEGDLYTNVRHPIYSNIDVATNYIYQVVLTYSGTSEILYLNGTNIGSVNTSGTVKTAEDDTVMAIGANPKGQSAENEFFDGRIYSVAIYDRALTTEEIAHNLKVDQIKYGIEKNEE